MLANPRSHRRAPGDGNTFPGVVRNRSVQGQPPSVTAIQPFLVQVTAAHPLQYLSATERRAKSQDSDQ